MAHRKAGKGLTCRQCVPWSTLLSSCSAAQAGRCEAQEHRDQPRLGQPPQAMLTRGYLALGRMEPGESSAWELFTGKDEGAKQRR